MQRAVRKANATRVRRGSECQKALGYIFLRAAVLFLLCCAGAATHLRKRHRPPHPRLRRLLLALARSWPFWRHAAPTSLPRVVSKPCPTVFGPCHWTCAVEQRHESGSTCTHERDGEMHESTALAHGCSGGTVDQCMSPQLARRLRRAKSSQCTWDVFPPLLGGRPPSRQRTGPCEAHLAISEGF